jgi:hypothetical protein
MSDEKAIIRSIAQSALGQTHDAIDLFHQSKFDSAITLAHAAQGMMPKTDKPHFGHKLEAFENLLGAQERGGESKPNAFANWLKHGDPEKQAAVISELEAIVGIVRAISKYIATYGGLSPKMGEFRDWAIARITELQKADA